MHRGGAKGRHDGRERPGHDDCMPGGRAVRGFLRVSVCCTSGFRL
ncbi:hypothetical protein P355_3270 [Burkholderia cenocepacia KC-01]|nr:hypothetical protein P355_3270 [Burkholderia cenocepacia KC-01]